MKRILIFSLVVNLSLLALTVWRKPHQMTLPVREVRGGGAAGRGLRGAEDDEGDGREGGRDVFDQLRRIGGDAPR